MKALAAAAATLSLMAAGADWRPRFHYSPFEGFMNDPNGLVYYSGEYHLFYQYNPYGDTWGHMSWGHAVSPNLAEWRGLLPAMRESGGFMIFSGSAVVDRGNTSGLCGKQDNCIVAIYTAHSDRSETQNIAYSRDDGRTFTPYERNPVLDLGRRDFRDPKVFWHAPTRRWIMAVALPPEHKALVFASRDLKKWEQAGEFGPAGAVEGVWECPDLIELPVDGGSSAWVFKVDSGAGRYWVGEFDGAVFRPSAGPIRIDYGNDFYAAQSFHDAPYGRRVWIGWMGNWRYANRTPTQGWRGEQSLARDLRLVRTASGLRLAQRPVPELRELRGRRYRDVGRFRGESFELTGEIELNGAAEAGFRVRTGGGATTVIGVRPREGQIFVDRTRSGEAGFSNEFANRSAAPLAASGRIRLDIWVDGSSVEVFADDGATVLTNLIYPPPGDTAVETYSVGGRARFEHVELWEMRPSVSRLR